MSTTNPDTGHLATNAEDPTGTKTTRNALTRTFRSRINDIAGIIRTTVDDNDAFRLKDTRDHPPTSGPRTSGFDGDAVYDFGTETDGERLAAWRAWISAVLDAHLLEPMPASQIRAGRHYTAPYIRQGYARGLAHAQRDAKRAGIADPDDSPTDVITNERHRDALAQEFLGVYDDLERAATDIRTETTRELSSLLVDEGSDELQANALVGSIRDLVGTLTSRVRTSAEVRLATVATSRVVNAVNEGVLRHGRELGAEMVGATVEDESGREGEYRWETAGDRRVCSQCAALEGQTWSIEAVQRGDAPRPVQDTHPNCRCALTLHS